MSISRTDFADGSYIVRSYPWGLNVSGTALCADGKVRKLARIAETADTFYSTPASVRVRGRFVAGYVTVETRAGMSTATLEDPAVLKFHAYTYCKNHSLIGVQP
jgi:hypothetical protein